MSTWPKGHGFPVSCVAALLGLGACQTSPPAGPRPALDPAGQQIVVPADAVEYGVVAEESLLQVLVYRGGPMARLGHNHVIASRQLEGSVYLTDDLARTRFDIRFPVNGLTVDEPALRSAAGADFPGEVPQSAREGTHKNLQSASLLDASIHPLIRLRATDVKPGVEALDVGVEITFKDQAYPLRVPVQVERHDEVVVARGELTLNQSQLGLKPFSVAMGTLVVLDEMRIHFAITARTKKGTVPIS